jgi:hypothetical protein
MKKELKQAIVNFIFDNDKEFQLYSAVAKKFRPYLFDDAGEFLIGGEEVKDFISDAIKLLKY